MNEEAKRAKFGEGEQFFKKAKRKTKPSFTSFRLRPDWEAAGPLFEKAALCFKQAGVLSKAVEAYEMAATANERMGSPWHAAKHLETCAELCKLLKWNETVAEMYRRAGACYVDAGKPATGAAAAHRSLELIAKHAGGECLAKGAKAIEELEPDTSAAMFKEAIIMFEADGREAQAADIYRAAIASAIKQSKWLDAATLLMKFGGTCDKANARSSQYKAYLGAVVVWLYAGDMKSAHGYFQDAMEVPEFQHSEEALAADALFYAYKTGDASAVKKAVSSRAVFRQLDNQVGRLAVRLPADGDMDKMARLAAGFIEGESDPPSEEPDEEEEVL